MAGTQSSRHGCARAAAVAAATLALTFALAAAASVTSAAATAPTLVAPSTVTAAGSAATFFVSGVASPGASVTVLDRGSQAGTATADASGFYSASVTLPFGAHSLTATVTSGGVTSDPSPAVSVTVSAAPRVQQGGKLTASDENGPGAFGADVALSSDGNTALIGAPQDANGPGAAWVFTRSGGTWSQQGPALRAAGAGDIAGVGWTVALSGDGNTALLGGPDDDDGVGAVWVFTRSGSTWTQGQKLTGGGEDGLGTFGSDVALSEDGNTAVVGASNDDDGAGAAWVFTRSGSSWSQQGPKLTGAGEAGAGAFGGSVAVSADGSTVLVGGPFDDGPNEFGAIWFFTRSGATWSQQGPKLVGSGVVPGDFFGWAVALSGDGDTALIGPFPDDGSTGRVWVYGRSGSTWSPQGAPVGSGTSGDAYFGYGLGLSSDGRTAVVGGPSDNGDLGAVWAFSRSVAGSWSQQGSKLTGGGESGPGAVGTAVAASADGSTLLAGGPGDNGSSGAAWVFASAADPLPAAPTDAAATPGAGGATVSFTAPAGPVSSYTVVAVPGGATATGASSPITVTGLTNGASYTFRVIAANGSGTGPASAPSNAIVAGAPSAPSNVVAIAGDETAHVSWAAPATDGGSPVTGYVVTPYVGATAQAPIALGDVTATTVTGLTNGTIYTFTVAAVNAVAPGVPSAASNPVTPALPRAPVLEPPAPQPRPPVPPVPPGTGVRPPPPGH